MNAKSSFYPAVIFACVLGVIGFLLLWLQLGVTIPTGADDVAVLPEDQSHQSLSNDGTLSASSMSLSTAQPTELDKQDIAQSPAKVASIAGGLRVSNQTDHPLRVALLLKEPAPNGATKPKYDEPVHWDFAPGEGSSQGLVLSLPEGNLKLKKGDILVAFAQDGSRRYWGPFVVGETDTPVLNRKTSEWQLILQP